MKIRQRVRVFDELTEEKNRLVSFIQKTKENNSSILEADSDDEEVIAAKTALTTIISVKEARLEEVKKELKSHDYFFKKTKTDLEKYRGTVEYIGEDE